MINFHFGLLLISDDYSVVGLLLLPYILSKSGRKEKDVVSNNRPKRIQKMTEKASGSQAFKGMTSVKASYSAQVDSLVKFISVSLSNTFYIYQHNL